MKSKQKKDKIDTATLINAAALQDHYLRQGTFNLNANFNLNLNHIRQQQQNKLPNNLTLNTKNKTSFQQSAQQILQWANNPNGVHNDTQNNIDKELQQDKENEKKKVADRKQNKMIIRIGHQKISLSAPKYNTRPQQQQQQIYQSSNQQQQQQQQQQLDQQQMQLQQIEQVFSQETEEKQRKERLQDDLKMRQYYSKLTLAQRLGLVPAPEKPLSLEDWHVIEEQSKKRQDSEGCCAICLDDFKTQEQVILSCSHVFHKQCLASFEKHNKMKACPICRRQHYEKKLTDEGLKRFMLKSVILIQKVWRGSQARKIFFTNLIAEKYKAEALLLRRKMLAFKLMKFSSKFTAALDQKQKNTQQVVTDIEHNIEDQKQIMEDDMRNLKHLRDQNKQQINEFLMYDSENHHVEGEEGHQHHNCHQKSKITQQQWAQIKEKAVIRCDKDCVICFNELCGGHKKKDLYLLSCSHVFHANCLNAFERYNLKTNQCCPICRSEYEKILYQ